jgi:hypothetical protein
VPQVGAFVIYAVMVVMLIFGRRAVRRAHGGQDERRQQRRAGAVDLAAAAPRDRAGARRVRVLAAAGRGVFRLSRDLAAAHPDRDRRLFALSLDLILGYAGIVSLGHAAFFGVGAYAAGCSPRHGWGDPLLGPGRRRRGRGRAPASSPASWCCAAPT